MTDAEIVEAAESAIVRHKGKWVSAYPGTYRESVTLALAVKKPDKVLTVTQITIAQYGRWTRDTEIYTRGRIWHALNTLLGAGFPCYPLYDPSGHHKLIAIKLVTVYTEQDLAGLEAYLEQNEAREDIACSKVRLVKSIIAAYKKLKGEKNGEKE